MMIVADEASEMLGANDDALKARSREMDGIANAEYLVRQADPQCQGDGTWLSLLSYASAV